MAGIRAVVFDMGGVLVRLAPLSEVLAGVDLPADELWERWILSDAVRRYERGACGVDDFAAELITELGVDLDPVELIGRFGRFPQGLFAGAAELVDEVRARAITCVLSNTNELHWTSQPDHEVLQRSFDREYLSFRLGLVKPDKSIFEHVAHDLSIEPSEILFLDDNRINVEGALASGWQAALVSGPAEARHAIAAVGLLE